MDDHGDAVVTAAPGSNRCHHRGSVVGEPALQPALAPDLPLAARASVARPHDPMGESEEDEKPKHPDDTKLEGNADFSGPGAKRHCTDCLCLLLIVAMWFSMTCLGAVVMGVVKIDELPPGDPRKLYHGVDQNGKVCGVDNEDTTKVPAMPRGTRSGVSRRNNPRPLSTPLPTPCHPTTPPRGSLRRRFSTPSPRAPEPA